MERIKKFILLLLMSLVNPFNIIQLVIYLREGRFLWGEGRNKSFTELSFHDFLWMFLIISVVFLFTSLVLSWRFDLHDLKNKIWGIYLKTTGLAMVFALFVVFGLTFKNKYFDKQPLIEIAK